RQCLRSDGGGGRYQRFRKRDGPWSGDRRIDSVQETSLRIDTSESRGLAERVEDGRDLGAAEGARLTSLPDTPGSSSTTPRSRILTVSARMAAHAGASGGFMFAS